MDISKEVRNIIEEFIDQQYFIVDILFINKKPKAKLTILMDGDQGISVDACAEISRHIAAIIEEKDLIGNAYVLEVSSPGVDRPLKMKRQYTKNIGRLMDVQLNDGSKIQGKLHTVEPDYISLEVKKDKKKNSAQELIQVNWDEIQKARVLISFG